MSLFLSTLAFRPYVFIFLLIYLAASSCKLGVKRTFFFTLSAWLIAYVSEFSSVRTGIPFGLYHYIPCTTDCELWICGVPFMDSLSFTFLSYTSWATARVLLSPSEGKGLKFVLVEGKGINRFSWSIILLGAFLMMLLDVVIDPLSLRGDRWFLGKIYYYPVPGAYFGVTIANFIGWFVVGAVTMTLWGFMDRRIRDGMAAKAGPATLDLWGPALYYIILLFNLVMTFYIGEVALGLVGVLIFLPVTAALLLKLTGRRVANV
jgi:uncharacterized membrane protein